MHPPDRQAADALDLVAKALAEWTTDLHWTLDPSMEVRYGSDGGRLWRAEVRVRLQHLAEAIAADRPGLFVQNALWSRAAFIAREVDCGDLRRSLSCMRETLDGELPPEVKARALPMIDTAIAELDRCCDQPSSEICPQKSNASVARLYLLHLLQRNQQDAANLVFEAGREGKSLAEIYETVITPALAEIGRMWHLQEASIADEHYCTAATQMIMAQLRARMPRKPPNGRSVLAASVGGDLHEVGIRMVADLFEMEGWQAEYLGANMPTSAILEAISHNEHGDGRAAFDLIALSANTTLSVRAIADLVAALRADPVAGAVPILVGGGPFRLVADLWHVVGADGFASDAVTALAVADSLVRRGRARVST
jgi:methanogenic corrinoid protein MtbC1